MHIIGQFVRKIQVITLSCSRYKTQDFLFDPARHSIRPFWTAIADSPNPNTEHEHGRPEKSRQLNSTEASEGKARDTQDVHTNDQEGRDHPEKNPDSGRHTLGPGPRRPQVRPFCAPPRPQGRLPAPPGPPFPAIPAANSHLFFGFCW